MRRLLTLVALAIATPAVAQSAERDYCPERPGFDTPPCIVDKGRVSIESAFADWTYDDQPDQRTDTVLVGQTVVRVGVTDRIEARLGWTPYGHQRTRDKTSGQIGSNQGVGDLVFGFKASLMHPDGSGLSIAVLPFASAPVGSGGIGAGDWGAGVILPISYSLSDTVSLAASPEFDAAVNESGTGRHPVYVATAGISWKFVRNVALTGELQARRDDDPAGATTPASAAISLAWMAARNLQFDVFAAAGLNRSAPDAELYAGIARRF